jgi:hypothetical protein
MKLLELVGNKADIALDAIDLVETGLQGSSQREILDNLDKVEMHRIIQGLCAIIRIWSYSKYHNSGEDSAETLVGFIRESVEWEADKDRRDGVHGRYQALNVLEASLSQDPESFRRQLEFLEEDQRQSSLTIQSRATEKVIRELVNWFRYYSWDGYGKTGPENCQDALTTVKGDIAYLLENGNLNYRFDY